MDSTVTCKTDLSLERYFGGFFLGGWGVAWVSCPNKFLTINYLDQHRSFVTLHRFPGDHDELDQNGFSRKGKNPLVLKVEVYP